MYFNLFNLCSYINCYLLTPLVYWIHKKYQKDESDKNSIYCFTSRFGTNKALFVFTSFFTSMHVLNFMFWIYVLCFNIQDDYMARFYYFTISRKEVPRKFWLDPRFPRNPKLKEILKWLPLDRDYFKVYFLQKGKVS